MSNIDTPIPHSQRAAEILAQLRTGLQAIPGYGFVTRRQRRRLTPAAGVSDAFLLILARGLEIMPQVASAAPLQPAEVREVVQFSEAYLALAAELELAARGLRDTVASHRAGVGQRALRAYKMSQTFERTADRELVAPHLRAMSRALGRGRPRSTPPPPEPLPPPERTPGAA